jgi:mono/diheme cytochrome c family protein
MFSGGGRLVLGVALATILGTSALGTAQVPTGLGRTATPAEIGAWGAIIGPNGEGLPEGRATAAEGKALYEQRCARCHGVSGNEGPDDRLVGGRGTLATNQPQKTVGSYWPKAPTLWDYVNRAMPFDQPGLLTSDEVYGIVAYVLYLNDIIGEQDPIDAGTLPAVEMPNRGGFVPDPRPDIGDAALTRP